MDKIILAAKIHIGDHQNKVEVMYDDDTSEFIYSYYNDMIILSENEFVGLTRKAALNLVLEKDIECLSI